MRKITYICHSGFLVELDHIQLLFDYYKGSLECVNKDKPLYVFASHRHPDHFVEKIFELAETYQEVHYILSNDIWKKRVPENLREQTVFLGPHRKETIGDVTVETLKSTDEGVAFLVETEGQTIYHAGDLNDWTWPGEPEAENRVLRERYRKEIDRLAGRKIDLAFVVLDGRQEEEKEAGMDYFTAHVTASEICPIHCWEDFTAAEAYEKSGKTGKAVFVHYWGKSE